MQKPPFPITAEDRAKAVAALMRIVETGEPADQIEAASVMVEMVAMNLQAERDREWLPKSCNN
ncbi:MAG: hypothetical protein NTX48_07845 [Planctomycetales bacterium]|nr:hypothetical protein [Planctomycetales bacterium]